MNLQDLPQPILTAIVAGVFGVAVGLGVTKFNAEHQRKLETYKYQRDWRRERAQPTLEWISQMGSLSLAASSLEGKPWPEADALAEKLQSAVLARPTGLLTAPIPPDLSRKLYILHGLEESWVYEFTDWFHGRGDPRYENYLWPWC
jgi:hypothetical protein